MGDPLGELNESEGRKVEPPYLCLDLFCLECQPRYRDSRTSTYAACFFVQGLGDFCSRSQLLNEGDQ